MWLICPTCGEKICRDSETSPVALNDCPHCGYGVNWPAARILGLALALGEVELPPTWLPTINQIDAADKENIPINDFQKFRRALEPFILEMSKMLQQLNPKLIDESAREQMKLFEQG